MDEEYALSLDQHILLHKLVRKEPPYGDLVPWYLSVRPALPGGRLVVLPGGDPVRLPQPLHPSRSSKSTKDSEKTAARMGGGLGLQLCELHFRSVVPEDRDEVPGPQEKGGGVLVGVDAHKARRVQEAASR